MHRRIALICVALLSVASGSWAQSPKAEISHVLDSLHELASQGDGERYFALFAEDAIFFGTDATERWTIEEFHGYADPVFSQGRGWTYEVKARHVFLGPGGRVAWFDEDLHNERYGRCRGTGVLVLGEDGWKISQYNLTIPIPNDIALDVVEMISEAQ